MSTVKSNKFSPQSLPIVQIDGFNDYESYVVGAGQTSFTASNFNSRTPVRAYIKTSLDPVVWTEVTVNFTASTTFEIVEGVSDGDEMLVYYQSGYYQGDDSIDDTQVAITSTNTTVNYANLKILLDNIGESALLESYKDYGLGSTDVQQLDLAQSETVETGFYALVDGQYVGLLFQFNDSGSIKQLFLPYGEQKVYSRDNESGSLPSNFSEVGKNIEIGSKSASFTISEDDLYQHIRVDTPSLVNITIPADSSYDAPIGATLTAIQIGNSPLQFVADTGVTINSADSLVASRTQYSALTVIKIGANEWDLMGDLA